MRLVNYSVLLGAMLCALPAYGQAPAQNQVCSDRIDLSASTLSDARRSLWRALSLTAPQQSGLFRGASMGSIACAAGYSFLDRWQPTETDASQSSSLATSLVAWPVHASIQHNSAYPRSVNDGAAWSGAGWNASASGGVRAQWRFLSASLAPEVFFSQNADFDFVSSTNPARTPFANAFHATIDYPTRFGTDEITTFDLGQSYLQARAGPVSFTLGKENLWIGAAEVYPILLSYTAPGFPHARIGTQRSINLGVARVEFQLVFGSLGESRYFDTAPENDDHYFTTTMVVVEPNFARGLFLGFARAYHDSLPAAGQSLRFYAERLIETPFGNLAGGNRTGNAVGVLLARWVLPESGFEAYAEWGREDTPGDLRDLLREPDWTQAYTLGFQKAFTRPGRVIRFYGELVHLGESAPARAGRGFYSVYTHSVVQQGHTHRGQLLGAAIGPGSDAQLLGVDIFSARGRSAFRIERTRYDDDTYYRAFARRFGETRHDAEITMSAGQLLFAGPLEIEGSLAFSRRYDRNFVSVATAEPSLVENNWGVRLGAAWQPRW